MAALKQEHFFFGQCVQISVAKERKKKSVYPGFKALLIRNVCLQLSYMQHASPVSAVVTIERGSELTISCQCLATALFLYKWQPYPIWRLFKALCVAIHLQSFDMTSRGAGASLFVAWRRGDLINCDSGGGVGGG